MDKQWLNKCCNPLGKAKHSSKRKNLRPVSKFMLENYPGIVEIGQMICDQCRKEINSLKNNPAHESTFEELPGTSCQQDSKEELNKFDYEEALDSLNNSLNILGESPISKKKLKLKKYPKEKCTQVETAVQKLFKLDESVTDEMVQSAESEMISQLKDKFCTSTSCSEKVKILTILPKSWSIRKVEKEFGASNFMVRKAKQLVKEKGILSSPNFKYGNTLPERVANIVREFYECDMISRMMPGQKDYVSVKDLSGIRIQKQKRLVLCNLKEVYSLFKTTYPDEKIGFSKFAELRPKHCILAGGSGTHTVCVCTTHQNVKLMIEGARLRNIRLDDGTILSDYKCILAKLMCNEAAIACNLNECTSCPSIEKFKQELYTKLDEELIEDITYKQWVSVDRCSLESITKTTEEFVESFCEKLLVLKKHSFIAKKQSEHYSYLKKNIKENEALVSLDFAENYAFTIQDEAQSFHWNNTQATIFPIAVYYKNSESDDVKFKSIVCISEHLKHDTLAVRVFQKKLISYLRLGLIAEINKIYYFSDGSAAQFKNKKNFLNLCHHESEFKIKAEWHFFATAHGKGVCDGLGGTVKRLAAKASLQRPYENQILTPFQLYTWCQSNIKSTEFFFFTSKEHMDEEKLLEKHYEVAKPIPGTQRFHSFLPMSDTVVMTKVFSQSKESYTFSLSGETVKQTLLLAEVKGFVTCEYNGHWWLCVVLAKNDKTDLVEVKFLHPQGPAPSFTYPTDFDDKLEVPVSQILTLVDPKCPTGRTYHLNKEEMDAATMALENYLARN